MYKNMSIKAKIILLIVFSLSLLTIILTVFSVSKVKESLLAQSYSTLTSARDGKSNQIKGFFDKRIADINVLSKSSNVRDIIYDLDDTYELFDIEEEGNFPVNEMVIKDVTKAHEDFFQTYERVWIL